MSIFSRKKEQEIVHEISDEEKRGLDFACCGGEYVISKRPGKRGALSISTVFACVEMISLKRRELEFQWYHYRIFSIRIS